MKTKRLKVEWTPQARHSLKDVHDYIKLDSPVAARKVKKEITRLARSLGRFPERFPRDPYLEDEPGNNRFAPIWHYKIVYEVTEKVVIIHDIFHTSRDPHSLKTERGREN